MENKMLKYEESLFKKILKKIRIFLFNNKKHKQIDINLVEKEKSSFRKSMFTANLENTDANIEIMRHRFEEGIIKKEDMTLEEIRELTAYYNKLTEQLANKS